MVRVIYAVPVDNRRPGAHDACCSCAGGRAPTPCTAILSLLRFSQINGNATKLELDY